MVLSLRGRGALGAPPPRAWVGSVGLGLVVDELGPPGGAEEGGASLHRWLKHVMFIVGDEGVRCGDES